MKGFIAGRERDMIVMISSKCLAVVIRIELQNLEEPGAIFYPRLKSGFL